MKINSFEEEENCKMFKKNTSRETNISMPNSKVDLIIDKNGKFYQDDYLKKISELNEKENLVSINLPKSEDLYLKQKNKCQILKVAESSENRNSNNNYKNNIFIKDKENTNTNLIESQKTIINNNEKSKKENYINYDFLSISDIDFDSEKDFNFIGFMSRKKLDIDNEYSMVNIYNFDSASEAVWLILDGRKIKVRLFLEANKFTAFNHMTDFKRSNAKFFPIVNLDFNFLSSQVFLELEKRLFRIAILGSDTVFTFYVPDKAGFLAIVNKVNLIVQNSKGYKSVILSVALRKEFYKFYYMSAEQFAKKSKSGDIMLFRGFEFPAKCQRCCTGAHYDHVALLIKKYTELEVYESTSLQGCKVRPWRYFLSNGWIYYYDKIIYRELIYNAENESSRKEIKEKTEDNLDDFLLKTKDKNYALPVSIICCPGKKNFEAKNDWKNSKGFFCSQLVAAAYLNMGIIDYDRCSLKYFPGSFSHSTSLPLKSEFSLGPEIIVDFSK